MDFTKNMGVGKCICEKSHFLLTPNEGDVYMSEFKPRSFGYSHSYAVMNALKYHVKNIKRSYIGNLKCP